MFKKKAVLGIFALIFLVGVVSAQYCQTDSFCDLKIPTNESSCLLTISYPNSTNLVFNQSMTINSGYANYSFSGLNSGDYNYFSPCGQGVLEVTSSGRGSPTTGEALNFLGIFGSIFFIAILFFAFSFSVKGALRFGFIATSFVLSLIIVLYSNVILSETINGFPRIAASYDIFYYIMLSLLLVIFFLVMLSLTFQALDEWRTKKGKNPHKDPH